MSIAIGNKIIAGNATVSNANILCNPNLVINPNFRVNTRGLEEYTVSGETCVDRWKIYASESSDIEFTATPTEDGLELYADGAAANAFCYIKQKISTPIPDGKVFVISIKLLDREEPVNAIIENNKSSAAIHIYGDGVLRAIWYPKTNEISIRSYITNPTTFGSDSITIEYVKIEYGENVTMFVAPDPAEEVLKCATTAEINDYTTTIYSEIASRPNILINSNFRINQRGLESYSGTGYTVDRWYTNGCGVTPNNDGINIAIASGGYIVQPVEFLRAGTYTISAKVSSVSNGSLSFKIGEEESYIEKNGIVVYTFTINENKEDLPIGISANIAENANIEWIKLEVGPSASLYSDPDPAIEMMRCQRYFQIRSTDGLNINDLRPSMRILPSTASNINGFSYNAEIGII